MVELPASEHGRPDVKAAKRNEVQNLNDYDMFEEVQYDCQYRIGSRWVVTQNEKHEGQKQPCQAS